MKLDILYKKSKSGKVVSYQIEYLQREDSTAVITKLTGQLEGKKIKHKEYITLGKNIGRNNETTCYEQAESQAKSDWLKKKDEGYKESIEELEEFNTDSNGNVKPMLAHDATKHISKVVFPVFIQPKFDGIRCLAIIKAGNIKFISRKGKEFTLTHLKNELIKLSLPDNIIFDGELYSDDLTFQEITSAVKAEKEATKNIKYRVYDVLNADTAQNRQELLWDLLSVDSNISDFKSELIIPTSNEYVYSWDSIKKVFARYISQGYEGLIIRNPNGLYGFGQRSYDLLKYKEFDEEEFKFLRWEIGQRNEDLVAVLTNHTNEFRAKMVGTKEYKEELRKSTPELVTVKYFGLTTDGIPRFPIGKDVRNYE